MAIAHTVFGLLDYVVAWNSSSIDRSIDRSIFYIFFSLFFIFFFWVSQRVHVLICRYIGWSFTSWIVVDNFSLLIFFFNFSLSCFIRVCKADHSREREKMYTPANEKKENFLVNCVLLSLCIESLLLLLSSIVFHCFPFNGMTPLPLYVCVSYSRVIVDFGIITCIVLAIHNTTLHTK